MKFINYLLDKFFAADIVKIVIVLMTIILIVAFIGLKQGK